MASRALVPLLAALAALLWVPPALAGPSSHPYFDDGGTLTWYRSYDRACNAARAEGKVVFIEFGRRICGSCKRLCTTVLPDPRVRGRLSRVAVGLASECDRPDPRVRAIFDRNVRTRILPFVAFVTPDGEYISGFGGFVATDAFLTHLALAEAHLARTPRGRQLAQAPRRHQLAQPPDRRQLAQPPQTPQRVQGSRGTRPIESPRRPLLAAVPTLRPRPCPPPRDPGACGGCETQPAPAIAPPALAARQAPARPPPPRQRPGRTVRAPAPDLRGDPDGLPSEEIAILPATRAPAPPLDPQRVGPPTVRILPPVKVEARTRRTSRRAASRRTPASLASSGKWGEVLKLCQASPDDPNLVRYSVRAHTWADGRLEDAVEGAENEDFEGALQSIEAVLGQMAGEPEYVDAARGLQAIKTLLELRFLNAEGEVARALRHQAHEDLRGTRWSRLFADA